MEANFSKEAREMGIPTRVFPGSFGVGLKKTREAIENGNYDIIHCHGSRANLTGALLKSILTFPLSAPSTATTSSIISAGRWPP